MHETGQELKEEQAEREQGAGENGIREALVGWETWNNSTGLMCELSDVENGLQHTGAEKQWNRQH